MLLRPETSSDTPAIRTLVTAAFRDAPHAAGTEADIVDALRRDGALTLSLVAAEAGEIVGHVAFSPVTIGGLPAGWFGLGPVAVRHDRRRRGLGAALVRAGLDALAARGAGGCVVLGDPAWYGRFGFAHDPAVRLAGVPAAYFQILHLPVLHLGGEHPGSERRAGEVRYHPAFGAE